jgi:hypothetical protein
METPVPSAAPPTAASSPIDSPPKDTNPIARPASAMPPMATLPIAITPLATFGRIVSGSIPVQMCTSGHPPNVAADRYSNPKTAPRAAQVRQTTRGARWARSRGRRRAGTPRRCRPPVDRRRSSS